MKYHGYEPTNEATALPIAPLYRIIGPSAAIFSLRITIAAGPSTCSVVFSVSIGVIRMRQSEPAIEANAVFMPIAMSGASASRSARTPVFAAVSPKRESGACMIAYGSPW